MLGVCVARLDAFPWSSVCPHAPISLFLCAILARHSSSGSNWSSCSHLIWCTYGFMGHLRSELCSYCYGPHIPLSCTIGLRAAALHFVGGVTIAERPYFGPYCCPTCISGVVVVPPRVACACCFSLRFFCVTYGNLGSLQRQHSYVEVWPLCTLGASTRYAWEEFTTWSAYYFPMPFFSLWHLLCFCCSTLLGAVSVTPSAPPSSVGHGIHHTAPSVANIMGNIPSYFAEQTAI